MQVHKGLRAPIGTTESVSLWAAKNDKIHHLIADHCNAEVPAWTTSKKANEVANGAYSWTLRPGADDHAFDNLVGCMALFNHGGACFQGVQAAKKRVDISAAHIPRSSRDAIAAFAGSYVVSGGRFV